MGAFEYSALDADGRTRKGVQEGDTPRQIRQHLREKGWAPLSVIEVRQREAKRRSIAWQRGISATDLALITRQFATLVRSGVPIEEALLTVSQQTDRPRLKSLLVSVRSRVKEGHSLAAALADFPHIFPDLYRATVAAGEQSGHLDAVLERLADYTETRQTIKQKMVVALIYPLLVTTVAILVVTALLAYVVPQVVQVFTSIGQELPLLTRLLIALSDFVRTYGMAMIVLLIVASIITGAVLRRPGPRRYYHQTLLHLPLRSRLVRGMNAARFSRTLAILVASGVPLLDGLRIAAQVVANLAMRRAVEEAASRVREGSALRTALERSGYFPPMTIHLIASGESSGNLEMMLDRAAGNQEREMEATVNVFLGLLEPLLIVTMGGIVLIIVLAILLPIFDLNQLVR